MEFASTLWATHTAAGQHAGFSHIGWRLSPAAVLEKVAALDHFVGRYAYSPE